MFLEFLETFATFVVSLQIIFGVVPWMWRNIMKPRMFQPVKFTNYGEWAGELKKSAEIPGKLSRTSFPLDLRLKFEDVFSCYRRNLWDWN
jgi:hypothetical protein